jgi:phage terminase large subunit
MGKYEIDLLPAQRKFIEIPDDIPPMTQYISLYQGGYGSGKTFSGSLKGLLIALKYPYSEGLVGASTYALLSQTTLPKYKEHLDNLGYFYDWNEKRQTLTLSNGSTILFKHFEDPEDLKSIDKHW